MATTIATWNINSVNARLPLLLEYLSDKQPDFMALQEIKCQNENFPTEAVNKLGYYCLVNGQKSYNGVALLSKAPLDNPVTGLPNQPYFATPQARFAAGQDKISGIIYISVYVPNGNPTPSAPDSDERLVYKLAWLDALGVYLQALAKKGQPFVLAGDFNVIIEDKDVYNPDSFKDNTLMLPQVRKKLSDLTNGMGLVNAFKTLHKNDADDVKNYSFWDYTMGAWFRDWGMLIDDIYLSPDLAVKLKTAEIDRYMRGKEKPSDHTPLRVVFD